MSVEWIIALLTAGLLLIFCEVFVPGGILGAIGAVLLVVAVGTGFWHDVNLGFGLLIATLVLGLTGFWLWVKYFPQSRMGKKLFLANDAHDWHSYDTSKQELVNKEGVSHTALRPSGTAIIEEQRVDVVTRGEMLEPNTPIRVVEVKGNRVVVASA